MVRAGSRNESRKIDTKILGRTKLKLNSEQDPFDSFIFSGLIFIGVIFIVLLGFYFMRTGISFMENQIEGETEINLENEDDPIESEEI